MGETIPVLDSLTEQRLTADELGIRHLDQYSGLWCMDPPRLLDLADRVARMDLRAHYAARMAVADSTGPGYRVQDGVAVVSVTGTITKYYSSLTDGASTIAIRRAIRAAVRDDAVSALLLVVDSPGGTLAGVGDLAEDVAKAAKEKPVWGYVEDLAASAGYWVVSQAQRVYANASAEVGSIGVFAAVVDSSRAAENAGVRVHVLRSGAMKGLGVDGAPITDTQLEYMQSSVDAAADLFVQAVSQGRRMDADAVRAIADGRTWFALEAKQLGLIDGVQAYADTVTALAALVGRRNTKETKRMSADPRPASYAELKQNLVGVDAEFVCAMLDAESTLEDAVRAWQAEQAARLAAATEARIAADQARAAAEARVAELEAAPKGAGVPPLPTVPGDAPVSGSNVVEVWNAMLAEKRSAGMDPKKAVTALVRENPELHRAYLESVNAGRR